MINARPRLIIIPAKTSREWRGLPNVTIFSRKAFAVRIKRTIEMTSQIRLARRLVFHVRNSWIIWQVRWIKKKQRVMISQLLTCFSILAWRPAVEEMNKITIANKIRRFSIGKLLSGSDFITDKNLWALRETLYLKKCCKKCIVHYCVY